MVFAVIGDYGTGDAHARAVARLVASWQPEFVVTTGDDYYRVAGGRGTGRYANSTGRFYARWLPGRQARGTAGSILVTDNAFFVSLGNHDYSDAGRSLRAYTGYFALPGDGSSRQPGGERYYQFSRGPVRIFVLNSNAAEPDGVSKRSRQAAWLRRALAAATDEWCIVVDHHPPYSSDARHGSSTEMRWPFARWGADAMLSGHAHTYERVMRAGMPYMVNGLGGAARYRFGRPITGSVRRYRADWGAQRVIATERSLTFEFYSVAGTLVDRVRIVR